MTPPEREGYIAGTLVKGVGKGIKYAKKHLEDITTDATDGQKLVDAATRGQRAARSVGRKAALGTTGLLVSGDYLLSDNDVEEVTPLYYELEDLPEEGSIRVTENKSGNITYSNSKFKKAALKAKKNNKSTFSFDGDTYDVKASLTALKRVSKAKGSIISEEDEAADRANRKAKHTEYRSGPRLGELLRQGKSEAEAEQQVEAEADEQFGDAYSFMSPQEKAERAQQSQAEETRRRDDEANVNFYRQGRAAGSLMVPAEGMPVDTYDNIPPEEMDEAMASQLPDDEMEDSYTSYVMDESLDDEEQEYLAGVLENDPRLSDILDKVITVAAEFSGAGEVDGPGTGVSDSIPARLSDGEFVITKKATDQIGADNLQLMMDDAERAYDGGYQMKAIGGYMEKDPEEQDSPLSQTDEEIKKLMMGANKMPSLR